MILYEFTNRIGDLSNIPPQSGVYMFYAWAKVVYVGRSENLLRRLKQHKTAQFLKVGATHARVLVCDDFGPLSTNHFVSKLERGLIAQLKPVLNGRRAKNVR